MSTQAPAAIRKPAPGRSLAEKRPDIAAQWDYEANAPLRPEDVTFGSTKPAYWACPKDSRHRWDESPNSRTSRKNPGCPVCSGNRVIAGVNDLAAERPAVAAQWDYEANGDLTPQMVTVGSDVMAHWICSKDSRHRWSAVIKDRAKGVGCRVCAGHLVVAGINDLATLHPNIAAQWDYEANNPLTPQMVTVGSKTIVSWVCNDDPRHRWLASVGNRVSNGTGCGVCAGKVVMASVNGLAATHPAIAAQWDYEANDSLTPQMVTAGSDHEAWWVCGKDSQHRWPATVKNRTLRGSGCAVCDGKHVLAGFNDLATLRPDIAAQWDYEANGDLTPQDVTVASSKRAHWVCGANPRHRWHTEVHTRTSGGTGCPTCSGSLPDIGVTDLLTTHPDIAAQWDCEANGDLTPQMVTAGSGTKAHWVCPKKPHHRWSATVNSRTSGAGCPSCKASKAETDLADTLARLAPSLTLVRNGRSAVPGSRFELDLYFPERALAVEFNGLYWHSEANGIERSYHADKSRAAREAGIQLLHVWEDDWRDRRTIVLRSILTKLGALDEAAALEPDLSPFARRVNARSCEVVEVSAGESSSFLSEHHIQGAKGGSVRLGLRDQGGALVALLVASVNGERATIERFATARVVRGGFGRLEKALVSVLGDRVKALVTFSDVAISDAGLYENGGWVRDGEIAPDYSYVVGGERVHKFNYRLKRFREDESLTYVEGMTERELATLNGLSRLWDAGKVRWAKRVGK